MRGSSLAPFFDNDNNEQQASVKESTLPTFSGISAVAILCGIESKQDVTMIQAFVKSLAGQTNDGERVVPTAEYTLMKQENEAYKALSLEEKEEVTRLHTMGPGNPPSLHPRSQSL